MLDVDHAHEPKPLPFERRISERSPASGTMQAVLSAGRDMPWVVRLGLTDASHTGLGATCDHPIEPGARLSLRVDPIHGNWHTGTVVRCEQRGKQYLLGIAYEARRAA